MTTEDRDFFKDLLEAQTSRQIFIGRKEAAQPEEVAPLKPYAIYEALEQVQPGINKMQTLREAKRMMELGYTLEQIVECAKAINADPWRIERGVPLNASAVLQRLPMWAKGQEQAKMARWTPLGG